MTPEKIGPYPIERELGRGGMGVVYLGRDTKLDRRVAIKVLPDAFAVDPERLARFEREARMVASLNHPNIAGIYGIEESEGHRFLALEYVDGDTLAEPDKIRKLSATLWLSTNPESESPRGFSLIGLWQRVSGFSGGAAVFSGSRESDCGAVVKATFTTGPQRTTPKLSESLFNNPLWVNTPVTSATQSTNRTWAGWTRADRRVRIFSYEQDDVDWSSVRPSMERRVGRSSSKVLI